jgi:hypothetical protein
MMDESDTSVSQDKKISAILVNQFQIIINSFGLLLTKTIPAVLAAISLPIPTAIPTSACANAGASFTPSPIMVTIRFCFATLLFYPAFDHVIRRRKIHPSLIPFLYVLQPPQHVQMFLCSSICRLSTMPKVNQRL